MYGQHLLAPMSVWRHVATGSTYVVLGLALCSTNGEREHVEKSVVYWSQQYRALRYREVAEFLDGRFAPLAEDGSEMIFPRTQ